MVYLATFELGEIVYLVHDPEQLPRMIYRVSFSLGGATLYDLISGTCASTHFGAELRREPNLSMQET